MTPYAQLPTHKPEEFLRTVGLSPEDFLHLHGKLAASLDEQKALNPMTRRGRKDAKLALEDRLLLTLYYFRHSSDFDKSGGDLRYQRVVLP